MAFVPLGSSALSSSTIWDGGTTGSLVFIGASSLLTQDNANLFWDDTNNRLGIGTATPASPIDVAGSISPAANANAAVVSIGGTIVEAGSGTHARLAGLSITTPSVTAGAGSVTDATTLYVSDAPTVAGAAVYAAWFDAGTVRVDGDLRLGGDLNDNNGNIGLRLVETASAINGIQIVNAATGNHPYLQPVTTGSDASIGLWFRLGGATGATDFRFQTASGGANILQISNQGLFQFREQASLATTLGTFQFLGIANTTNAAASTEIFWVNFALNVTKTWATGALTTQRFCVFQAPTIAFAGASTVTDTATVYISGAPIAGTNATLTNTYPLWIDAGTPRIDSGVALGGGVAPTLGTIGGSGPATAAQNEWLEVYTQNGKRWIPCWA